jgi:hypothetical protein
LELSVEFFEHHEGDDAEIVDDFDATENGTAEKKTSDTCGSLND